MDNKTLMHDLILQWFAQHRGHVLKLMENNTDCFQPSNEDFNRPELWKAGSWNWFFKDCK